MKRTKSTKAIKYALSKAGAEQRANVNEYIKRYVLPSLRVEKGMQSVKISKQTLFDGKRFIFVFKVFRA